MRPIQKGAQPGAYSLPANLAFQGNSAAAVQQVSGTSNPTLANCLNTWLAYVKATASAFKPANYQDLKNAVTAIKPRIDSLYKQAALPLIHQLGEFCSYCESYTPGHLDVEHAVPKAEFPTFATDWDNFLLACLPCNIRKSNTPTRIQVRQWLGRDIQSEIECNDQIRNHHHVWPDRAADSYRVLPATLYWNNGVNWQPVPPQHAFDTDNSQLSVDLNTEELFAHFPNWGNATHSVQARIDAITVNPRTQAANETIALCSLNRTGNATYDRRVLHRTQAWLSALAALRLLNACGTQQQFDLLWSFVGFTASTTGFFSVWLRIFGQGAPTDPSGTSIAARFVADFGQHFKNSNAAQLP